MHANLMSSISWRSQRALCRCAAAAVLVVICARGTALAAPDSPPASATDSDPPLAALVFAPGSAALALGSAAQLDDAVTWAHAHPAGLIVLDGHADPTGARSRSVQLSLERAKAVRTELVTAGVNPEQIVIAAFATGTTRRDRSVVVWGTRGPAELERSAAELCATAVSEPRALRR